MEKAFADIAHWKHRKWTRTETISRELIERFKATLSPYLADSFDVPLGAHWCLCPDVMGNEKLGEDGHPRLGQLLPDPGLPRRMWAGGELRFHQPFAAGERVTKESEIEDLAFKDGKSGRLCFLTLRHRYAQDGGLVLDERQDIVYRAATQISGAGTAAVAPRALEPDWTIAGTSTLLFRYSALTFNGHRIHYDADYARDVEGYAGLVVHGPLQATYLLNLAALKLGSLPQRFSYRGLNPVIAGGTFGVSCQKPGPIVAGNVMNQAGVITMQSEATA